MRRLFKVWKSCLQSQNVGFHCINDLILYISIFKFRTSAKLLMSKEENKTKEDGMNTSEGGLLSKYFKFFIHNYI